MYAEIFFVLMGIFITVFIFRKSYNDAKHERKHAIDEKIKELGGKIIKIEKVDRERCPYGDELENQDTICIFYRIRYEVEKQRRMGYAVLQIKQNWYGPALAGNTKWTWHLD